MSRSSLIPGRFTAIFVGVLAVLMVASLVGLQSAPGIHGLSVSGDSGMLAGVPILSADNGDDEDNVLRVPSSDYPTIQSAVDAADEGDVIKVSAGNFAENVLIEGKEEIRLVGKNTILQGSGDLDTAGIGIHILNSEEISIRGFVVQGFELGVLLEGTEESKVSHVETRFNDSNNPTLRDGLALWNSTENMISHVAAHDNGHNGITFRNNSSENTVRQSTANNNGQNPAVSGNNGGCGIQLIGSGHHQNRIMHNETNGNGWGIQIGGGSNDNRVVRNESHGNARAGVVALDSAMDNLFVRNDATGNGLANIPPSFNFDLFDQGVLDNTWRNNQGTSNF